MGALVPFEVKWSCLLLLWFVSLVKDPSRCALTGWFQFITTKLNCLCVFWWPPFSSKGLCIDLFKKCPKYKNIWSSCTCRSCNKGEMTLSSNQRNRCMGPTTPRTRAWASRRYPDHVFTSPSPPHREDKCFHTCIFFISHAKDNFFVVTVAAFFLKGRKGTLSSPVEAW